MIQRRRDGYTETEKHEILLNHHYENNYEQLKLRKTEWANKNNRASVNEKARFYRARQNLKRS